MWLIQRFYPAQYMRYDPAQVDELNEVIVKNMEEIAKLKEASNNIVLDY